MRCSRRGRLHAARDDRARTAATITRAAAVAGTATGTATDTATGAARGGLRLPIDDYALTTPEIDRIGHARDLFIGHCMRRLGFAFDADAVGAEYAGP